MILALAAAVALLPTPGEAVANPSLPGQTAPATTVPERDANAPLLRPPVRLRPAVATDPARPLPPPPTATPDLRLPRPD